MGARSRVGKALASGLFASVLVNVDVIADEQQTESLNFTYWKDATPPFLIEEEGQPVAGIIKDLADGIASKLELDAKLLLLPVARIEPHLKSGMADIDCLTSPIWKETPDAYHWSPKLFSGYDRFLLSPELNESLHTFADLKGLTLGIYQGYVYHPDIMSMIQRGDVKTVKLDGVEHGIKLLNLKRIDALIDFGVLLSYQIDKHQLQDRLVLSDFAADEFDLHCAYSKKIKHDPAVLDQAITQIIKSGEMNKILQAYR